MNKEGLIRLEEIQNQIYMMRGLHLMLDEDLACLYGVETRVLNQAVKRNLERFPKKFCFQLTEEEYDRLGSQSKSATFLRSQSVTFKKGRGKHRKYLPYVFTEQGVAMLSAVLRSEVAIKMSVQVINAFVALRRFFMLNAQVFQRLDTLELKQLESNQKINRILNAIESKEIQAKQGIFFDGQVFDAYEFVSDLVRSAEKSIILVDNYIDDSVLTLFSKRNKNVSLVLLTKTISKQLELDVKKFNEQYPSVELKIFNNSHDRFLIIDNSKVYHIGASLKDLGKKWFAFSKIEIGVLEVLAKLEKLTYTKTD